MRVRVLLATAFLMRLWLVFRYRFDSDEPQHMHVAWGWANGFVQYRDIFDNHMPLFHLLTAPLFFGGVDDPRLLFAARLLMLPLFLMAIVLVWLIARRLFGFEYRDINYGFRVCRREQLLRSLDAAQYMPTLLNAELLIRAHIAGDRIKEIPVHHRPRLYGVSSGIHPSTIPAETFKAFKGLWSLKREAQRRPAQAAKIDASSSKSRAEEVVTDRARRRETASG